MPCSPILGNAFKVRILSQRKSSRLYAPSRQTRVAISSVANHGQVIRNRCRADSELRHNARLIAQDIAPAVELDDSRAGNTLAQVLVRGANEHLLHAAIFGCLHGGRGQRIVGLIVDSASILRKCTLCFGFLRASASPW